MRKLLYTAALNDSGILVKAVDAEKNNSFVCPVCKTDMILRKSGKTGMGAKRPHFAHRALTTNCTPESALHYSFKRLLAEKIQRHLENKEQIAIHWRCCFCREEHSGNLLKKVAGVRVEFPLEACQPDIVLLDSQNRPFAVIEVVVTHSPDEKVLEYYVANNIVMIQINLTSDSDIDCLDSKINKPDVVTTCVNPKCNACGNFKQKKTVLVIDGCCWKCEKVMKIAVISAGVGSYLKPSQFSDKDKAIAKSQGVILRDRYSKQAKEKYTANVCSNCGAFAGDFYLFSNYIAPAGYGELPLKELNMGFYCDRCSDKPSGD